MHPSPHPQARRLLALGLLPLAGVIMAACSSNNSAGSTSTTTTTLAPSATAPTPATGPRPVVTTKTVTGVGKILVNAQGQTLYSFTQNGAPVPCSSSCLQVWPAVTLPSGVTAPTGSAGVGTLGTTTANGVTQVTVGGLPLFTYDGDSTPGVASGNNLTSFGGIWKVVKAQ
jgi:predicted lipoprotein with Yx(FWY)xxD motif